jgi:hypothetical protein
VETAQTAQRCRPLGARPNDSKRPVHIGVTEGTRTPDPQGHDLRSVTRVARAWQVNDGGDDTVDHDAVDAYQPYHAARADLLARTGCTAEAITAYDRAIELTSNPTEHRVLARQREVLTAG